MSMNDETRDVLEKLQQLLSEQACEVESLEDALTQRKEEIESVEQDCTEAMEELNDTKEKLEVIEKLLDSVSGLTEAAEDVGVTI